MVSSPGRTAEVFERFLEEKKFSRRVVLSVPHMLCVPFIIANSDLVLIVPQSVGLVFRDFPGLRIIEPPLETPRIRVALYWSARFSKDPGNASLRSVIAVTRACCVSCAHCKIVSTIAPSSTN